MKDEGWSEPLRPVRPRPRPGTARRWGTPQPSELEDTSDIRALLGAIGHLQQSVDELRARTEAVERRTATMAAALDVLRRHQIAPAGARSDDRDALEVDALRAALTEAVHQSVRDAIRDASRTAVGDAAAEPSPAAVTPTVSEAPTPRPTKKAPVARTPRAATGAATGATTGATTKPAPKTAARRRTAG